MASCFTKVQSRRNPEIQKLIEEDKTDRFQQRNGILVQVIKQRMVERYSNYFYQRNIENKSWSLKHNIPKSGHMGKDRTGQYMLLFIIDNMNFLISFN